MIEITSSAREQIRKMMREKGLPGASLRLGVKQSGCSGLEYTLDFAQDPAPGDQVQEIDGLRVLVDAASAAYLEGIRLDWGNGLLSTGFKFTNPNADRTCGCGKSFSV